jgi:hypothetical protein
MQLKRGCWDRKAACCRNRKDRYTRCKEVKHDEKRNILAATATFVQNMADFRYTVSNEAVTITGLYRKRKAKDGGSSILWNRCP